MHGYGLDLCYGMYSNLSHCLYLCEHTVNLGNDSDTAGAIYGQLAGAYYGVDAIPESWRKVCSLSPLILLFADELYRSSLTISEAPPLAVLESTYLRGVQRYAAEGTDAWCSPSVHTGLYTHTHNSIQYVEVKNTIKPQTPNIIYIKDW